MTDGDAQADGGTGAGSEGIADDTLGWRVDVGSSRSDDAAATAGAYRAQFRRRVGFVVATLALLLAVAAYGISTGPIAVPLSEIPAILAGQGSGTGSTVIWNIRLPRIVAAVGAGAGLAVAGAVLQSVLRNPLASPYTLGISLGAAFGAAFSIVVVGTGTTSDGGPILTVVNPYLTSLFAFGGALVSTGSIYLVARFKRAPPEILILTGIALASLFTAGTTSLEYFATNTELATLVFWKFGDVSGATWRFNTLLWLVVLAVTAYFVQIGRAHV